MLMSIHTDSSIHMQIPYDERCMAIAFHFDSTDYAMFYI